MTFSTQPISEIIDILLSALEKSAQVDFQVLDPDLFRGVYAGTKVHVGKQCYLYRSLRAWMELAELLGCRMLVPQKGKGELLHLTFEKLGKNSFHTGTFSGEEKYGSNSPFSQIHKMEEPTFYHYYKEALIHAGLERRGRILDLGINRADEFEVIRNMLDADNYEKKELCGIDHSKSAIEMAKAAFPEPNVHFHYADINALETLGLGRFDLLISIGTLQSPGIAYKPFLMELVQKHLRENSALILGFPNARWRDGELVYGAKAAHYNFSEMGVVLEDIIFAKKYLQQKRYRVMITGKQYLFLTAVRIGI